MKKLNKQMDQALSDSKEVMGTLKYGESLEVINKISRQQRDLILDTIRLYKMNRRK